MLMELTMKKSKMKYKVKVILCQVLAIVCCVAAIALASNAEAKATAPKLIGYEYTAFGATSNEIFKTLAPYTQVHVSYKKLIEKYKPLLIRQLAKASDDVVAGYHVRRAAISTESEAEEGTTIIYYETIYSKNLCEVSAVTVYKNGNYSILTSLC